MVLPSGEVREFFGVGVRSTLQEGKVGVDAIESVGMRLHFFFTKHEKVNGSDSRSLAK